MSLTAEDKDWVISQLNTLFENFSKSVASTLTTRLDQFSTQQDTFSAELNTRLGALEARVDTKLEKLAKSLSSELSTKLTARFEAFEVRVDAKLEHLETKLLTEFHKWASPQEMRQRTHAAALRAIDLEIEAISDRVTNLERPTA